MTQVGSFSNQTEYDVTFKLYSTRSFFPTIFIRAVTLFRRFEHIYICLDVRTTSWCRTTSWWGRVTHICVGKLTIIDSDNGLSPGRRQAIILTNAGILLIEPLRTNFSEILIGIQIFSFKKMRFKMLSAKWRPVFIPRNSRGRSYWNAV